ncbi:MAG: hypothetical protein A2589_02680 [Candidatus Vogelbacteria bacterium RIFOXYD1_FULL_46_19]|uniref:tRNA N6-adenosine threonylcarbamoyltransferase n=1 Tax=Candidatus Vogelbacteria bacterium RIFOXYD1_FULL_46_19 TaxID=1802439 RepID=A0A1G2QIJ0_9BACT|nr:MAG: hypothetical protein A2589_02680 [Candidatus Vogelbacteria bacterium RIFOXYD1_FULL_46_19]
MTILAIETSCDDTAISIVDTSGDLGHPTFQVLAQIISSQTSIHAPWGGVVPNLAKREHLKNLLPVLDQALTDANLKKSADASLTADQQLAIAKALEREPDLAVSLTNYLSANAKPNIEAIAVTAGPGLEPALWAGITFAEALASAWNLPLIPVNHLEGHVVSPLLKQEATLPALALIVSGGHTELIEISAWGKYQKLGSTRDDSVGEAFDKVARLLNLPYPGGPAISKLALEAETNHYPNSWQLPRPMIDSPDLDFSFSGLKTAVRYALDKKGDLTPEDRATLALEFEQAVVDTLMAKVAKALSAHSARSFILGGGVAANQRLRQTLTTRLQTDFPDVQLLLPEPTLATDNATMIALAAGLKLLAGPPAPPTTIRAQGNLSL